jgi:hypothetical protein
MMVRCRNNKQSKREDKKRSHSFVPYLQWQFGDGDNTERLPVANLHRQNESSAHAQMVTKTKQNKSRTRATAAVQRGEPTKRLLPADAQVLLGSSIFFFPPGCC